MTAPEPLTLTPEEALRLLRERGMELTFDSNDATPWAVYRDTGEYLNEYVHFGQSEEEVLSLALGVPVAARDEAAELRALVSDVLVGLVEFMQEVSADSRLLTSEASRELENRVTLVLDKIGASL